MHTVGLLLGALAFVLAAWATRRSSLVVRTVVGGLATLWWVELLATVALRWVLPDEPEQVPAAWSVPDFGVAALDRMPLPAGVVSVDSTSASPDVLRIAVIGDSFVAGQGVRPGQELTAALERALAARGVRAEVLNHGIPGADAWTEAVLAEDYTWWSGADIVVWVYVLNDLASPDSADVPIDDGIVDRSTHDASGLVSVGWARTLLQRRSLAAQVTEVYRAAHDPQRNTEDLAALQERLQRVRSAWTERGGRFLFVVHPLLVDLDDYPFVEAHHTLDALGKSAGAESIDLLPAFVGQDAPSLWASTRDHHPNAIAHARSAEVIADALQAAPLAHARPIDCAAYEVPTSGAPGAASIGSAPDGATLRLSAQRDLCRDTSDPFAWLELARARLALGTSSEPRTYQLDRMISVSLHQAARLADRSDDPAGVRAGVTALAHQDVERPRER